jgi:ribonuclease HII
VYQAGIKAMEKALQKLSLEPEFLLIDGRVKLASINGNQKSIVDGDAKVFTIACASIVAKVTRDRMMRKYHKAFPHYGFDRHKGYGTKLHLEKLKKFGPCEIHRKSYAPVKRVLHRV